jgi:hypothetical protein
MTKSEKIWLTPELVILVRSKPEETVLTVYKGDGTISSAESSFNECLVNEIDLCREITTS